MNKTLWHYSQTFDALHDKFPGLSVGELAMWVYQGYLTAYENDNAAYPIGMDRTGVDASDYEDRYGIRPFSFSGAYSSEDLTDCFFDPDEIAAFIKEYENAESNEILDVRYLTFSQLVNRWRSSHEDVQAFVVRKILFDRKDVRNGKTAKPLFYFWAFDPLDREDAPVEECLFLAAMVTAREREWFPREALKQPINELREQVLEAYISERERSEGIDRNAVDMPLEDMKSTLEWLYPKSFPLRSLQTFRRFWKMQRVCKLKPPPKKGGEKSPLIPSPSDQFPLDWKLRH